MYFYFLKDSWSIYTAIQTLSIWSYWPGVPLSCMLERSNRWGTMETVTDFIFLGSKITVDDDCGHEIKRRLFLEGKALTNLNTVLKSRDITLPTKVHIVKVMVFPVVMHGCESWTKKKAQLQRIDALELWCWRRDSLGQQGVQTSQS